MSDDGLTCPVCGAALSADAPEGLCPKCVIAVMMDFANADSMEEESSDDVSGSSMGEIGDYEIIERIAAGGMGVVYRARQKRLGRLVALKLVSEGKLASETDKDRFLLEAQSAGELDHPNIVPIYEVGEDQGQYFFSMRLVTGGNLSDSFDEQAFLNRDKTASGSSAGFRERQTANVKFLAKVAHAVHYAHSQGILHRDLKPANILIDGRGEPQISDFGLAKRVEDNSHLTASGQLLGSPAYMSPEQAEGKNHELTPATDVYAIGVMLYQALTGTIPFDGETPIALLQETLTKEPKAPRKINPRIDRDLDTITLCCLEKAPTDRYPSAEALAHDLERWLDGRTIEAKPSGPIRRASKWIKRKPAIAALAGLSLVATLIIVSMAWVHERKQSQQSRDTYVDALHRAKQFLDKGRPIEAQEHLGTQPANLREFGWHWLAKQAAPDFRSVKFSPGTIHALCEDPERRNHLLIQLKDGSVKRWNLDETTVRDAFTLESPPTQSFRGGNSFFLAERDDGNPAIVLPSADPRQGKLTTALTRSAKGFLAAAPGKRPTVFVKTSGERGDTVSIWMPPWKEGRDHFTLEDDLLDLAVSPLSQKDPKYRVAFCFRAQIEIWHLEDGIFYKKSTLPRKPTPQASITFSPDGRVILLGDPSGRIIARNRAEPGATVMSKQHHGAIQQVASLTDAFGVKWVAAANTEGEVRAWEIIGDDNAPLRGFSQPLSLAANGSAIVTLSDSDKHAVKIVPLDPNGADRTPFRVPEGETVVALAFADPIKPIIGMATEHSDESIHLYHCSDGQRTRWGQDLIVPRKNTWADQRVSGSLWRILLQDGKTHVIDFRVAAKTQVIQAPTNQKKLRIFGSETTFWSSMEDQLITLTGGKLAEQRVKLTSESPVNHYTVSADRRTLAAAHADGNLQIWHLETGKLLLSLGNQPWEHLAFSTDGATLIGYHTGTLQVWDARPTP